MSNAQKQTDDSDSKSLQIEADGEDQNAKVNIDARESKGFIYKATGTITQYFGTVVNRISNVNDKLFLRLSKEARLGFVLLAVVVAGFAIWTVFSLKPKVTNWCEQTGLVKVGIAPFTDKQGSDHTEGIKFSEAIYSNLDRVLQKLDFAVEVRGTASIPSVKGSTELERATSAKDVQKSVCSSLLIYGTVETVGDKWVIEPQFEVTSPSFEIADELTGAAQLGTPISVSQNSLDEASSVVQDKLSARVIALAYFVRAVSQAITSGDFDASQIWFAKGEDVNLWKEKGEGKEVLYAFMSSVAARLNDLSSAQKYLDKAVTSNASYFRTQLMRANILYRQAIQRYEDSNDAEDVDVKTLKEAIAAFEAVAKLPDLPPTADLPTRVDFGLGQCYFAIALSTKDPSDAETAAKLFEQVIAEYGDGRNPRMREQAAESYARIARLYHFSGNRVDAIKLIEAAIALTHDPERGEVFKDALQEFRSP